MRILFWQWHSFMGQGVERAFQKLNMEYDTFFYQLTDWEADDTFEEKLEDMLSKGCYDVIFSINYTPLITDVCERKGIPYISWVYDAPVHIRNREPMKKGCNHIYFFDRAQAERAKADGVDAYHLPLAADSGVFAPVIRANDTEYQSDVSLLGKLYQTEYEYYRTPLTEYLKGYLEGIVQAQMKVYGGYLIPELLTGDLLSRLNECYRKASGGRVTIDRRELEFLLASEVTGRERYMALALLSRHCDVALYSGSEDKRLQNVRKKGYVDYYKEMPRVFASSKVNLNISLRAIESGIPLRVLDVLSCGGFLISNYQSELGEYFRFGDDIVVYENLSDLVEKTLFYLAHDSERERVARNGRACIEEKFRFEDRIQEMFVHSNIG